MPRARVALALTLLALACGAPPSSPPPQTSFAPRPPTGLVRHARLADEMPRSGGLIEWDATVQIGGEMRPAVTSGRRLTLLGAWDSDAAEFAHASVPPEIGADVPIFAKLLLVGSVPVSVEAVRLARHPETGEALLGPIEPSVRAGHKQVFGAATVAPDVTTRDLASGTVNVPRGAVLDTAYGVESSAWAAGGPAVEFTIIADDGTPHTLLQTTLDPVRVDGDRRWVPVRIPLDAFAGRDVRFRFVARAVPGTGTTGTLPVWSNPVVLAPAQTPLPIGIVLVSLDTLRGRSTSSGGAWRDTTPVLEREVMGQGVTFDNALTTAPHTLPAHISMMTGRYLRTHGIRSPLAKIPAEDRLLAERLGDAGWATGAFTEDGFVVPEVGLSRGFDTYRENKSADLHQPLGFADAIFASGLEWLATHRDRAFFLFLHTYQVHLPYVPPPPYDLDFDPAVLLRQAHDVDLLRYEQEARYLDDMLGAFLDGLDRLGLAERTLVVITSDHGEEFKEHGQLTHGHQLFDEVARVPLVMRLPGAFPAGRRVPTAVSLVDVAPTILDLVGLPPMRGADGRSLVPLLMDGAGPFPREAVFAEAVSTMVAPAIDVVAYRAGDLSCVFQLGKGGVQCFDRGVDPGERVPLVSAEGQTFLTLARERVAQFVAGGTSAAGGTPAVGVADPDRFDKLKALGYVGE